MAEIVWSQNFPRFRLVGAQNAEFPHVSVINLLHEVYQKSIWYVSTCHPQSIVATDKDTNRQAYFPWSNWGHIWPIVYYKLYPDFFLKNTNQNE